MTDEKVEEGSDGKEVKERQMSPRVRRLLVHLLARGWSGSDWAVCLQGRRRSQVKVERESPCRPEKRGAAAGDAEEQREIRKRFSRKVEDSERGSEEEEEDDEDEEEDMERRRADR